jgi:heme exporter protein A
VSLRADLLGCRRAGRVLFSDLSLNLAPGELLQIVGANGSGKTTLLRILCGLRQPDTGAVFWKGRNIDTDAEGFTAELMFIGFQPGLKLELSPRENLEFAAAIAPGTRTGADEALRRAGLSRWADTPCRQLSTGQIRRAALARLAMFDRELWILDEPLTGLDQVARADFESAMFAHAEEGGMVVFTTHQALEGEHRGLRLLEMSP